MQGLMRRGTAIASLQSSPSACSHVCHACIVYQTRQVPAAVTLQNEVKGREVQWRHVQGPKLYHTALYLTKISRTAVGLQKGERNTYCSQAYTPEMLYVQSISHSKLCCSKHTVVAWPHMQKAPRKAAQPLLRFTKLPTSLSVSCIWLTSHPS